MCAVIITSMKVKTQSDIIKFAIQKLGTAEKLAEKLGISSSFARSLSNGETKIPLKRIKALASITSPEITEQQIIDIRIKQTYI